MKKSYLMTSLAAMALLWAPLSLMALEKEGNAYKIGSPEDMVEFSNICNGGEAASAFLTADIDLTGVDYKPLGTNYYYVGVFDGRGHTVTVNIITEGQVIGLFSYVTGSETVIKNLTVRGDITTSDKFAGGVVGVLHNGATVENCASYVNIHSQVNGDGTHGGIVAYVTGEGTKTINCLFAGSINGEMTNQCGGIIGWAGAANTEIRNCLAMGQMNVQNDGCATFSRNPGNVKVTNCYYSEGFIELQDETKGIKVTAEQLKSGEVTSALNLFDAEGPWKQTLGQDETPMLNTDSKKVYAIASEGYRCDGQPLGDITYTNEPQTITIPEHQFGDSYICSVCGFFKEDFIEPQDGIYNLSNAAELAWFAEMVNNGNTGMDARLTADITLEDNVLPMIGTETNKYTGTFDGQFHTVTMNVVATAARTALFRHLNGTVRNLRTAGRISTEYAYACGIAAIMYGCTIENCISSIEINNARGGQDYCHAGIAGRATGAGNTIRNCVFDGKITGEDPVSTSGIVGWVPNGTVVDNCLQIADIEIGGSGRGCFTIGWGNGALVVNNCYYKQPFGAMNEGATQLEEDKLASGYMCYQLNENQNNTKWTQTLGEDSYPLPWSNHKEVYPQNGNILCSGALDPNNMPTFSNENTNPATREEHNFNNNGVCTKCGFFDETAVPQLVDGYYEIFNATQWKWFCAQVAAGETQINGRLTADVILEDEKLHMIGTDANPFAGTFDGQGHTLTFNVEDAESRTAPFRHLSGTVRNLHTAGRIHTNNSYACGIAAIMYGCTIENCISSVEIFNATGGQDYCHAGIAGRATGAGNTIRNCIFDGRLAGETPQSTSGIVGWAPNATLVENCLQIADVEMGTGRGTFTIGWSNGSLTVRNTYYKNAFGYLNDGSKQVTDEQLASGEVCVALNEGQEQMQWSQNLEEDLVPVNNMSRGAVYKIFETYINDGVVNYTKAITNELSACEDMLTNKEMLESYKEAVDALSQYNNITDLLAAYEPLMPQRQALLSCRDAYTAYKNKVDETIAYLEEHSQMTGEKTDLLSDYLNGDEEPGENFANGAAQYILENGTLTEEEIIAETAKIDAMLQEAIISSPTAGTEITRLLVNPDFRDSFNGWEGEPGNGITVTEQMVGAESWAKTMDMHQTLTGLQNGVYELQVNGAYRPNEEYTGTNYAAFLYANGIQNYFQADIEDIIFEEDAQDGVNCNITGSVADYVVEQETESGTRIGYIMHGTLGCALAFQAGRYKNSVLVEVTDGALTVGIKKLSTRSNARDWLGFGNVKLIYRGSKDEATGAMQSVLANMAARANVLVNVYEPSINSDYPQHPSFSQALKDELEALRTQTFEKIQRSPEDYYAMIQKFSDLFQQVYDCKNAYLELGDCLEDLFELSEYDPTLADEINAIYDQTWAEWEAGKFTQEEALAKKQELEEWIASKVANDIPEPDLLDVVFNADGTATDKSAMANEISSFGDTSVLLDSDINMNVFDETAHTWSTKQLDAYYFDMTGDLWDKLSDGFSIEAYVCPTWEGDNVPTNWCGIFGMAQSGGLMLGVSSQKWLFQASINGSWANGRGAENIVKDKWAHLVGVWNQTAGTLSMYVDGDLTGLVSASGELRAPQVVDDTKCYIGADMNGTVSGTEPEASFQGKIAYIRLYDVAMPGAAATELYRRATATAIDEIASDKGQTVPVGIYNIMGQRVQKAQHGIFIMDGKKVFVK